MTVGKGKPRDLNQCRVDRSTAQAPEEPAVLEPTTKTTVNLSEYMASIGRKGGQIGGKRRLKTMSRAQRQRIASKAARTRWKQTKKKLQG